MMRGKYSLAKRTIAFVLSLVLLLSVVPATGVLAAQTVTEGIVQLDTDPYTLNAWKDTAFDPYNLTTEHAGGVWTDKSVLSQTDIAAALPGVSGLSVGRNNFLVALSALAANSVVTGRGTTPTDTVFVLDISGSMSSSELSAMVSATNDAIHTLLTGNPDSRIGVVLYSTRAYELLELGRYTPVVETTTTGSTTEYIELTSNTIRTARITERVWVEDEEDDGPGGWNPGGGGPGGWGDDGHWETNTTAILKDADGNEVDTSVSLRGGTYIQGGLWTALQQFNAATVTDTRNPVLVLMSDGAPTYLTNDYNNVPASYESGDGNSSGDGDAFLSQLTAAYVKEKMAAKYGTAAYMYTLGLGVSDSNYGTTVAEAMLDTSKSRTNLETYWDDFLALATAEDKTMSVELAGENWDVTVTYDATVTSDSREFVDKYFPASDASQLSAAFQGIVNEISLKAGYTVTRLDGAGTNASGYVTFVDEIGTGMQVKNIKGILIGDHLFTGEQLAKALIERAFGTVDAPTDLGNNMVWALKQRLGITETAVVHDLIQQAYDAGQIAYNAETGEFSNYIGWYSDENGDYLGFWDYADADYPIPADAAYANMSYGMLGTTTDSQTAHASDMMYVAVMVSKQITEVAGKPALEAKTPELVTFRVPASLLPTVTYQINVDAEADEEITADTEATITYIPADPIRLLYEVGVHSQLTPENIHEFVREGYQAKDEDGNYYLYTNAWYWEPSDGSAADFNNPPQKDNTVGKDVLYNPSKNHITYAHFEPGENNEHYYYTEDTVLYVKNGDTYIPATGTLDTTGNTTYYYKHRTFVSKQAATATNTAVAASVDYQYGAIDRKVLSDADNYAQNASDQWYIKEGTMRYSIHSHDRDKTENTTGSFFARMHNLINIGLDGQEAYHSELVYLGNNGRVTYAPAQGFTLSKAMAEGAEATGSFTFEITVTGDADGKVKLDGVEQNLTNNKLTASVLAGQSVTVTGVDVGAEYTITEQDREGYKLGGIVSNSTTATVTAATATVSDTVQTNKVHEITFTNDIQEYGNLLITKDVTYNKGVDPQSNDATFQMIVWLEGMAGKTIYSNGAPVTLGDESALVVTLKDGEQALITGIPEGTAYTVTEKTDLLTDGYSVTAGSFSGNIEANETAVAAVKNTYTPDDVVISGTDPAITLQVTKRLEVDFDTSDDSNNSYKTEWYDFLFLLQRYNATTGDWDTLTNNATITIKNPAEPNSDYYGEGNIGTVQISMENITFDSVGNHYFRVKEEIPANLDAGWTYDRTHHDFVVVVTDANLDGKLEIASVEKVDQTVTVTPTDTDSDNVTDVWAVGAGFLNNYAAQSTKLTIAAGKTFTNTITGENLLKDGQFTFALYETGENFDITGIEPELEKNGAGGDIIFTTETYPFNSTDKYYYYVLKEASTGGNGITVDDSVYEIRIKVSPDGSNAVVSEIAWREKGENYDQLTEIPADNVFKEKITFANTYTPAPVEQAVIKATKTLTNLTPGAAVTNMTVPAQKYSFTLSAVTANAPMPAHATVFAADGGAVSFGEIEYTKAGTYQYKLTENDTGVAGVTYDKSEYTVTVVVTDNGTGNLVVSSVTYTKGGVNGTSATFANTYLAKPVTGIVLKGTKVLKVDTDKYTRALKAGEFHFTLTKPDGSKETVSNDANGDFSFSALSFDTVGSYDYTITEYGAGQTHNGVQYNPTKKTVTVTIKVEDNGEGQLVAKVNGSAIATYDFGDFENIYTATSATVKLEGYKDLVGRDLEAGEFSFTLTAKNGAPMPEGNTTGFETVTNAQDGTIAFGTITYDAVGTHVYTIVENKLDDNGDPIAPNADGEYVYKGVTYSQLTYTVTVTVTDNGIGQLVASVATVDDHGVEDPVEFANQYQATSVTVNLEGDKANTEGKTLEDLSSTVDKTLADFEFKFQLMDAQKNVLQTVTENNAGFDFEDIEFTTAGTYTYYIAEVKGTDAGITYDETLYRVTVTIEDNLEGQMVVKELKYEKAENADSNTFEDAEDVTFANTYKAKKTSVSFAGKKTMEGGRKLKGDDFSFVLTAKNGAPMPEGNTTGTETVKNDADGFFAFSAIEFTAEGEYVYTLVEQEGDNELIDYDGTEYTLTVTVKDVNGELVATTVVTKGEDEVDSYGFTNIYTPADAETSITVQKVLKNESDKTMGLDGYTFQLELDGQKTTLTTGTDGKVKFDLTFTAKDVDKTFTYKLTEVKGSVEGMTYDETVYEIKIAVTQNDDGELILTTTRKGTGDFTFTNTYAPPAPPTENPKTGDDFNIHGWTLMMAVSAVCGLAVLVLGKKKLLAD